MSQSTLPVHDRSAAPIAAVRAPERTDGRLVPRIRANTWANWTLLVIFAFITLESVLLALVLQGRWLILFAPGLVCAGKALETWREIRGAERNR